MTTLTKHTAKKMIRQILKGANHRFEVLSLINEDFFRFSIDFFKQVVDAKLEGLNIANEKDWYRDYFINSDLPLKDIIINSGLNAKSVGNMELLKGKKNPKERRKIVLSVANENYDSLLKIIEELTNDDDIDLELKITLNNVSVSLTLNETLIVVNVLAVKRAALRGGHWSIVGKRIEKPLMQTLCALYKVPAKNWDVKAKGSDNPHDFKREADFFLIDKKGTRHKCEVKLMGPGNTEGADAVYARESKVFVASTLSDNNKKQLNKNKVQWVQLRDKSGRENYARFRVVLENLDIPHKANHTPDLEKDLPPILDKILGKGN